MIDILAYIEGPANTLPRAGGWIVTFMLAFGVILIPVFPVILHFRRKRAKKELHERIERARAEILADGIVEGPKGPYVPHKPYGRVIPSGTPRDTIPRQKAYRGIEWP